MRPSRRSQLTWDNPIQQARLPALEALAAAKIKRAGVVVGLRRSEGLQGVANAFAGGEGRRLSDGIRAIVHDLQKEELGLLALRKAASDRSDEGAQRVVLFGSALGLLIVAAQPGAPGATARCARPPNGTWRRWRALPRPAGGGAGCHGRGERERRDRPANLQAASSSATAATSCRADRSPRSFPRDSRSGLTADGPRAPPMRLPSRSARGSVVRQAQGRQRVSIEIMLEPAEE